MSNLRERLSNLERMKERYDNLGNSQAVLRVEAQIKDLLRRNPVCDVCHSDPCQCDVQYDKGMDREMFPDD